jgi:hypothetical protein
LASLAATAATPANDSGASGKLADFLNQHRNPAQGLLNPQIISGACFAAIS